MIVDLDPALIDNSFVPDRMEATEEQNAAFRELIRQHGQNVPILVRPKPGGTERYEVAFGHRRLRAARELGIKVRAVVRSLTDEQLVIAQGQENSGRTDLTFIERARFAARLEDRKFSREIIMASLNVDKAALSRLIRSRPGCPPRLSTPSGQPGLRPCEVAGTHRSAGAGGQSRSRPRHRQGPNFQRVGHRQTFRGACRGLRKKSSRARAENWAAKDGTHAAKVSRVGKRLTLTFDDRVAPKFGDFVRQKLQTLYDEFKAGDPSA